MSSRSGDSSSPSISMGSIRRIVFALSTPMSQLRTMEIDTYFWRTKAAAELDFVTDYEGVLLPIEVIDPTVRFVVTEKLSLLRDGLVITETEQAPPGDPGGACFIQTLMAVSQKFLKRITNQNLPCSAASAMETAVETVAPTIGLLPIPIRPIIST